MSLRSGFCVVWVSFTLGTMSFGCSSGLDDSPTANFDALWEEFRDNYSFFELKGIDWQQTRAKYQPLVREGMSERELFTVFSDMLSELRDSHVGLKAPFDQWAYKRTFLDRPDQFDFDLLERSYFPNIHVSKGGLHYDRVDEFGYLRAVGFEGFDDYDLDIAQQFFAGVRGLIVDLRENPGGDLSLAELLAGRFTRQERVVGAQRHKTGPGPNDYSEFEDIEITPSEEPALPQPAVVLIDRGCYSACTFFTMMMRGLDDAATLLGDRSGGGGGAPIVKDLPNGWKIRITATQTIDSQGNPIEEGLDPDIQVDLDPQARAQGIDSILERALEVLRSSI